MLIISFEFDGVLNLDFLGLDLELTLALELSADFGLELVFEVTGVFKFSLDLGLSAGLEFKVVLGLASEFSLFLADLDVGLDLELTSAVAAVDGSLTVTVLSVDTTSLDTVAASLGLVALATELGGLVTIVTTLLGEATLVTTVDLVVVVVGAVLGETTLVVTVITVALVTGASGEVSIVDLILVDVSGDIAVRGTVTGSASNTALLTVVRAVAGVSSSWGGVGSHGGAVRLTVALSLGSRVGSLRSSVRLTVGSLGSSI